MFKTKVEIVTGFLGSGKTAFINSLIENTFKKKEKLLIVQLENGVTDIDNKFQSNSRIILKKISASTEISKETFKEIIDDCKPNRIIIEYNGTQNLEHLLSILDSKVTSIYHIADGPLLKMYIENMGNLFIDSICNSNLIVVNNANELSEDKLKTTVDLLRNLNTDAIIVETDKIENVYSKFKHKENSSNGFLQNEDKVTKILILAALILFVMIMLNGIELNIDWGNFSTIFTSIFLETMPFIMIGAFCSAIIQVFVSEEFITRIIPKNKFLGLFLASIIGIIFPMCECGIIPVGRRLIKKGVPLNIAVTFILAVPIVNPISIFSTYYAFYNKPSIVIMRCVFGILISISIGYIIGILEKNNTIIKDYSSLYSQCSCCSNTSLGYYSSKSPFFRVINHTSIEFFNILKYLILGALLSSFFQVFIPRNFLSSLGNHRILSILVMIALSYILSICSSADAFIAKTFLNQFTLGSIMCFLISGPMIDIKNTLMLFGNFKNKFVLKLIFCIFLFSFVVGICLNFTKITGIMGGL